ncbi:hypothetical protein [Mitsuaria sp. GD03876]|uniref:hypothetical protein n=1 Tax=Mitsuaria sp. GD03876 TaxID=2975399 RepID=UPI00244C7BB3|nr:hypothetical protein [Mitsuaria sp. GD03876]MDH0868396.1 hypothetical protein [Mitsuaria sp. GD03876]
MTPKLPDGLLTLAGELVLRKDEASLRTAASRAYYAVFLLARKVANVQSRGADAHARTQQHFAASGYKDFAKRLGTLRKRRNSADYIDERPFSRHEAFVALSDAHELRREMETMPIARTG